MKTITVVLAALVAGFLGGAGGATLVLSRQRAKPQEVIRARSFELAAEDGQTIAFWGVDKNEQAVLAFGRYWPPSIKDRASVGRIPADLRDPSDQRVTFGIVGESPVLDFRGRDGKSRSRLYLNMYDKPILLMMDETGPRVSLGIEQSDTPSRQDHTWSLSFEPNRASIGMYPELVEGKEYVRGAFSIHAERATAPGSTSK
jgi:hypothetical protein